MRNTAIAITLLSAVGVTSLDAAIYNGNDIADRTVSVATERIEVRQVGNVVETTLPWRDQPGIKVKYDLGTTTIAERMRDKRDKEILTEIVDFGDGGFKVDVLLNNKPDRNIFCYEIEGAENYNFLYQAALTPEEVQAGNIRPDNIVGSYAVYHQSLKDGEYKTGKFMHIPRPEVWEIGDPSGTKEWATLSYNEPNLCVTVRQEFLDNANYPVRVDPTFGYTSQGASDATIVNSSQENPVGLLGTLSEDGDIASISTYVKYTTQTKNVGGRIYAGSAGSLGSFQNATFLGAINSTSYELETVAISPEPSKTATTYWLEVYGNSEGPSTGAALLAYDTGGATDTGYQKDDFSTPQYNTNQYSIYATYTATGSETPTDVRGAIVGNTSIGSGVIK